jgi:hypothetical protein
VRATIQVKNREVGLLLCDSSQSPAACRPMCGQAKTEFRSPYSRQRRVKFEINTSQGGFVAKYNHAQRQPNSDYLGSASFPFCLVPVTGVNIRWWLVLFYATSPNWPNYSGPISCILPFRGRETTTRRTRTESGGGICRVPRVVPRCKLRQTVLSEHFQPLRNAPTDSQKCDSPQRHASSNVCRPGSLRQFT